MNASEIFTKLTQQGVDFWVEDNKLNIRSPKGIITPEIQANIIKYKADILALVQEMNIDYQFKFDPSTKGISLQAIGKLISGFSGGSSAEYQVPVINPKLMAQNLQVTFRPLPEKFHNYQIMKFRQELASKLKKYGVNVIPWLEATAKLNYEIKIPLLNWKIIWKVKGIKSKIDAVIDVERPNSLIRQLGIFVAETSYKIFYYWLVKRRKMSVIQLAKMSGWAENHVAKFVEDPTNTQIITITNIDDKFVDAFTPYQEKISIGINKLIETFSEIVVGISAEKISILNMNLSDSIFRRNEIERFVLKSLIPKIFTPIAPLSMNRFQIGEYQPRTSIYAEELVKLGEAIASTGLLPPKFKLAQVLQRQSHRDIVNTIINGRTYGFVAYMEPPQYVGKRQITVSEWEELSATPGFSINELRQNEQGRRYVKITLDGEDKFQQVPDIWLVSSRCGANKTNLNLDSDIIRIGLREKIYLQLPVGSRLDGIDIKPSYDIYVMLSISLAAALYLPELIQYGAPIVHFHGYPSGDWFGEHEYCVGVNNPSVPCGTYESGVLNFLGIANLEPLQRNDIKLISLIEPDHGVNFIAHDPEYLVARLQDGCRSGQIELGGRHFASLRANLSKICQFDDLEEME